MKLRLRFSQAALTALFLAASVGASASQLTNSAFSESVLTVIAGWADGPRRDRHMPMLADFYQVPSNGPVWVTDGRANAKARELVEVLSRADRDALNPADYRAELLASQLNATGPNELAYLEVSLSAALLNYTRHLGAGRVRPQRIDTELAIEPVAPEPLNVLAGAKSTDNIKDFVAGFEPQTPRYLRLREALQRFRSLAADGGWPRFGSGPVLKPGMPAPERSEALRQRLMISGDLAPGSHTGTVYDGSLVKAVERFQARHGLEVDGVIGENTLTELNTSARQRVQQIELNMERRRWMEDDLGQFFVFDQADLLHVGLEHFADFCDERRHETTAFLEVASLRIKDLLQLFCQEDRVATLAEHR